MTEIFIYIAFGLIVAFDVVAVILQNKRESKKIGLTTITSVFRRWFKTRPLVPFMIGGVFIGHFGVYQWNGLLIKKASLIVFLSLSGLFLAWNIIEMLKKNKSRLYDLMLKVWLLPMTLGTLVGSFWK